MKIFLFKLYESVEFKQKNLIEIGQMVVEISSLKVLKKFSAASILIGVLNCLLTFEQRYLKKQPNQNQRKFFYFDTRNVYN